VVVTVIVASEKRDLLLENPAANNPPDKRDPFWTSKQWRGRLVAVLVRRDKKTIGVS
jgi:hypothetical protein